VTKLTIKEAAKHLDVSEQVIWKRLDQGLLEYSKENGYLYVHFFDDTSYNENNTKDKHIENSKNKIDDYSQSKFIKFLEKENDKKDAIIESLHKEIKELNEKYAEALKENTRLTQGVHLEARKLIDFMLPYNIQDKETKKGNKKKKTANKEEL